MKKFLSLGLSLIMMVSLTIPAFAAGEKTDSDLIEKISAEIDSSRFTVEYVDEVPDNVTPLAFDTWEEAVDWINSLDQIEIVDGGNQTGVSTYQLIPSTWPDENYHVKGDLTRVMFGWLPSGTGTYSGSIDFKVPGLSAQTVTAHHYFRYSNGRVTDWSVYANISGIGLATYSMTYDKLERHDVSGWNRYFGVCVGNFGYYLEIAGVPIGFYESLELTYVLSKQI